jgi:hypothetical protein
MPGLFPSPLYPTIAVHTIAGSVHPRFSAIRWVLPIADASPDSRGRAT